MHTAEEVRKVAKRLRGLFGQHELREMLLAYVDLLEAMEHYAEDLVWMRSATVANIRQRAAEIAARRKGT